MTPRIFWAGDSTVKQNNYTTYPQTGIGQGFSLFIKKDVLIYNHAENGRSTKSFLQEGRLIPIAEQIRKNDFLFIQFGHNDEKPDEERHTDAFGSFQTNLAIFIETAQKKEAHPVLITPLYRRLFDEHGILIEGTHMNYPDAMIETGKRFNIPVIDLCTSSRKLLIRTGDERSKQWFMQFPADTYANYPEGSKDNTHLVYAGAVQFSSLIAQDLRKLGGIYAQILIGKDDSISSKDQAFLAEECTT